MTTPANWRCNDCGTRNDEAAGGVFLPGEKAASRPAVTVNFTDTVFELGSAHRGEWSQSCALLRTRTRTKEKPDEAG